MASTDTIFHTLIHLVGKEVEVGNRKTGASVKGIVANAMPDSFILTTGGKTSVIPFQDILFVREMSLA